MAPAVQGTPSVFFSTTSPYTPTLPDPIMPGELLVAHVTIGYAATNITNAQGWTRELFLSDNFGGYISIAVFTKIADASETAPTFTISSSNPEKQTVTAITRVGGVDSTTPVDVVGTRGLSQSGTGVTLPAVTTTKADTLLLGFVSGANNNLGVASINFPVSMTEIYDQNTTVGSIDRGAAGAYEVIPAAGSTGTRVTTTTNNNFFLIGSMIALRSGGVPYTIGALIA